MSFGAAGSLGLLECIDGGRCKLKETVFEMLKVAKPPGPRMGICAVTDSGDSSWFEQCEALGRQANTRGLVSNYHARDDSASDLPGAFLHSKPGAPPALARSLGSWHPLSPRSLSSRRGRLPWRWGMRGGQAGTQL